MDAGHKETEAVLAELEKRITKEYMQAEKEISAKLDDYLKRFETKDKIKREAMEAGKITKEEYEKWRTGQIMIGKRWEEMRDSIAKDLANASQIAKSVTNGYMPEVYAINHNYGTFQVEKTAHIDTSYTLYDRETVERLYNDDVIHWHAPGKKTSAKIATGEQMAWDKKQVQSVMTQSILQGESIGQIATRLAKTVGESDRKAAIRNARTMTTGVENAGRIDSYERAEEMGIELEQEWLATIDDRTRHEHRLLDGQRVKVGEKFEVEGEEIAYPGDPEAAGYMIYNCRCTLIPALKGHPADHSMRDNRSVHSEYEDWKNSRYEYHDPITKQDDIAEMMRRSYIEDYRYLAGESPYGPISPATDPLDNLSAESREIEIPEDVEKMLDDFRSKYQMAKNEHYLAINRNGEVIYESPAKMRAGTAVSVPKWVDENMEGGYSIHNHPAVAIFSDQDIRNYERYGEHGFVRDLAGNDYILYNLNPVSVDSKVKNAVTEEEVAQLLPFSTAVTKVFDEIENDIAKGRREYGKELVKLISDPRERTIKMQEWMKENDPEVLKDKWLKENAEKYGFIYKKIKR